MNDLTDRLKTKLAMEFEKLMIIGIGTQSADEVPYRAIRNALAFERTSDGYTMLAPMGDWYTAYALPHHSVKFLHSAKYTHPPFTFGNGSRTLDVVHGIGGGWIVMGDRLAFNPHFWESSVIPSIPSKGL